MPTYDLIIRNGTLVMPTSIERADIAVADGRIAVIAPDIAETSTSEIDAAGLHIFPGVIDAHVHCNEPGRTEWEGFSTATRALAAGGATSFFDMPLNAHPPTVDAASFGLKLQAAQASSHVDFALWGGLVPDNLAQMDELAARGVIGFKAFMSNSGIEDFAAVDDLTLYDGMQRAAKLGRIVAVHAENDQITSGLAQRAITEGRTSVRDYLRSRPVIAEVEAIERAILLAEETGCKLHIVHVSSGRGVALVAAARARSVDVSCETCPHYLALTDEDAEQIGALAKCAPPLRSQAEQDALWQHLRDGTLPMVASDHSPAPTELKGMGIENAELRIEKLHVGRNVLNSQFSILNFFAVWGGISGCQSTLQVLLTEGHATRNVSLSTLAAVTSGYVARRFALLHKGRIEAGADADLALVDLAATTVLHNKDLLYKHQHSPYVGRAWRGRVVRTLVRGTTVWRDGTIVGQPSGQLLKPQP